MIGLQSQVLTYGPWGGNGRTPHDIGAASSYHLKSVTIRYGDIIDSLTFSYSDQSEHVRSVGPWGGTGGANKYTVSEQNFCFKKLYALKLITKTECA